MRIAALVVVGVLVFGLTGGLAGCLEGRCAGDSNVDVSIESEYPGWLKLRYQTPQGHYPREDMSPIEFSEATDRGTGLTCNTVKYSDDWWLHVRVWNESRGVDVERNWTVPCPSSHDLVVHEDGALELVMTVPPCDYAQS